MTKSTVTTERLREIIERRSPSLRWGEAEKVAAELLAVREAQPLGFTHSSEISNMQATGLYLRAWPVDRRQNEQEGYTIPLYTAPPAPAVPAELLDAMAEVIRISDRDHEAWDRAKAAISACRASILTGGKP